MKNASLLSEIVRDLHIEYKNHTLQIGLVYVAKEARGLGLVKFLLDKKIETVKNDFPEITEVNIQVFGNNVAAIRAYEKSGFHIIINKNATLPEIVNYMPGDSKVVMQRSI